MTIVLCGGGSAGHITPLLAVASELRARNKSHRIIYVGERGGKFAQVATDSKLFDEHYFVSAGKLRRYHGESFITKLFDFKTNILNFRDIFRLFFGFVQSRTLLKTIKPDVMLLKGGFVCVPVALAAQQRKISYITHDSDALPGLSNRIAAKWARYHAVALPPRYYSYPSKTVRQVGVPTDPRFREYTAPEQGILREKYGIAHNAPVLLITGGSNGARRLNETVIKLLPKLLQQHPDLQVLHQLGEGNEDQITSFKNSRVDFFAYSRELYHMSAIADVVVTRAGASILADLATQRKTCIVVPNPFLTGGHQLKNAQVYEDAKAALIVQEKDMDKDLGTTIDSLLKNPAKRAVLAENLHAMNPAQPAAAALSDLLEEAANG